jgi:hypothetical protein
MKTIRKGFDPNLGNQFQQDYSGSVIGLGRSPQKQHPPNLAMDEQEQFDQEQEPGRPADQVTIKEA